MLRCLKLHQILTCSYVSSVRVRSYLGFVNVRCFGNNCYPQICNVNPLVQPSRKYTNKNESTLDGDEVDNLDDGIDSHDEEGAKIIKATVKSLRLDLVIKSAVGLARNRIEAVFYDNKIRVNGCKVTKKSMHVEVDDEIDIVKGFSPANPAHIIVTRVYVLSTKSKGEAYHAVLKLFKNVITENYSGENRWK